MKRAHRQYLRNYLLIVLIAALSLIVLNGLADPYNAYPVSRSAALATWRDGTQTRQFKAETIAEGDWQVLLFGSSRAQVGLNPGNPVFGDLRVYNAGLPGAQFDELMAVVLYGLHTNPSLGRMVILIHPVQFFASNSAPSADYAKSLFNPELDPVDYHAGNLLGAAATEESMHVVRNWLDQQSPSTNRLGFRTRPVLGPSQSYRQAFEQTMGNWSQSRKTYHADRMTRLREVLGQCARRGVQVDLLIAPTHVLGLMILKRNNMIGAFDTCKRDMTNVARQVNQNAGRTMVRIYDALIVSPWTCEPVPEGSGQSMQYFWEQVHFKDRFGDAMLQRIWTGEPSDVAVLLESGTIDAHFQRQNTLLDDYELAHPKDVAWVQRLARTTTDTNSTAE
ncbi:hypothetical protein HED60_03230 [Planctomycetales bacterium ZRK34]|nr:hypothetical protein HED60_03230 [Planctomycetales bacterium ZRK34]